MRHFRFSALASLVCAVAASVLLSAGQVLADPQAKVVTGDSVRTRSGPGEYWYPTGKLNRGDKVMVVGKQFGWAEITPPQGQLSLILKSDVDLTSQLDPGGTGVVKGDQAVPVRACPIEEARSNRIQCYLRPGAAVTIFDTYQVFYRIVPPAGATVFIKSDFLALSEPGAAVVEQPHTVPGVTPRVPSTEPENTAASSTSQPATVETVAAPATQPVAKIVGLDIRARVAEDNKLIKEQLARPIAERDFSALVARMEELKAQNARSPMGGVGDYADAMIDYANRQAKLAAMVRTMAVTRPDIDKVLRDAEASMATKPADYFQAVGLLNKSVALGGSLSMPNLHKLETADGQSVLAYVVPENGADWSALEGKTVQVTGRKQYRADWKVYLVRNATVALVDKTVPAPVPLVPVPPPAGTVPSGPSVPDIEDILRSAGVLPATTAPDTAPDGAGTPPPVPAPSTPSIPPTPPAPLPAPGTLPLPTPAPAPDVILPAPAPAPGLLLPAPSPVPAAPPTPPAGPEGGLRPLRPAESGPVPPTPPVTAPPVPLAPASAPAPVGP